MMGLEKEKIRRDLQATSLMRDKSGRKKQIIREISQADGLTASLVDLLIEKVYVFPGKRIEIAYKFHLEGI